MCTSGMSILKKVVLYTCTAVKPKLMKSSLTENLYTVLTAGNDGQVRVWEVATGMCKKVFKGHDYPINCMTVKQKPQI